MSWTPEEGREFAEFTASLARQVARPHLAEAQPSTTLTELGLDSLATLELLVALDNLGALREDRLRNSDPEWLTSGLGHLTLGELYMCFVALTEPEKSEKKP